MPLWQSVLLGIIQGLTEFLPISSTAHLLVAQELMGRTRERKTSTSYALGLLCECGTRRSDGSRRWCAECRYSKAPWEINSVEAATSPWWEEPDGVLARVRGDADVVREIVSLKGL